MANRYWVGGTATWDASTTSVWSATSGGAGGASVPTSSDNVFFDQAGTYTVTVGANFTPCANLTVSATTYTFQSNSIQAFGSITLASGTVWGLSYTFGGTGSYTLTTNGVSGSQLYCLSGATITLGSALTLTSGMVNFSGYSTLNTNGYSLTSPSIGNSLSTANFNFGTSAITATAGGSTTRFTFASVTCSQGSTFTFSITGTPAITFYTGTNNRFPALIFGNSSGTVTIIGTNCIFQNISSTYVGAKTFQFFGTHTFEDFGLSGTSGNLYTITSYTGSPVTLKKSGTWYVGANSTDSGNNTGLTFTSGGSIDYLNLSYITGVSNYGVASTIIYGDYNIFATGSGSGSATNSGNVNNLWGTGNGQYGWGQGTTIGVNALDTITAAQWSTLSSRINSIRSHQTGTGITFTNTTGGATSNFTAGQIVYHVSNLSSALSTAYTAANTASATTGSMACYSTAQQGSTTTSSAYLDNMQPTELYMSFTWTSAAAMRYFFNSGGYLEFAFNVLNAGGSSKNASWANLAQDLGTIRFGGLATAYTGYSGTWNTNTSYGLNNVPTTETLWWKKYNDTGVADYNNNYIQCTVYNSGATIYFHVTAVDAAADDGTAADYIYSNLDWTGKVYEAGQTYITKTWGTVSTSTFPAFTSVTNSLRFRASNSAYLTRTPASTTNRQTYTLSCWVKRGVCGTTTPILDTCVGSGYGTTQKASMFFFNSSDNLQWFEYYSANGITNDYIYSFTSDAVFRDPSAWYHIVCVVDTTQAVSGNRISLYVNGIKMTSYNAAPSYPSQNLNTWMNTSSLAHYIGRYSLTDPTWTYSDFYLAEMYFIDGQALGPNEFAAIDSHGVYRPISYTGTYGNNGFYLNFADNSALTTSSNAGLGKDTSGKGNYWTTNNISITSGITYDSMIDVPVNAASGTQPSGNYAVLNPNWNNGSGFTKGALSSANLKLTGTASSGLYTGIATLAIPATGTWYWEFTCTSTTGGSVWYGGIMSETANLSTGSGTIVYYAGNGNYYKDGTNQSTPGTTYTTNDVIGFVCDIPNNQVKFYKNGTLVYTASYTFTANLRYFPYMEQGSGTVTQVTDFNFGQRPFAYSVPTGASSLCSSNLTAPTIG
jgi:hypothetical protein